MAYKIVYIISETKTLVALSPTEYSTIKCAAFTKFKKQ